MKTQPVSCWAVALASFGIVNAVIADTVVHDTSAEFAAGAFSDTYDTGSGANPAIKIVYNTGDLGNGSNGALIVGPGGQGSGYVIPLDAQYTSVTIASGYSATANDYPGGTNGVVRFKCQGTVTIDGSINVTGRGYRGGPGGVGNTHGYSGESYTGYGSQTDRTANGGGGGAAGNWGSGGGGGYGTTGQNGFANQYGFGGNVYGDSAISTLYLGSGGGGASYNNNCGAGGDGGGAVQITASTIIVNGSIASNGNDGQTWDISGGAGAGGSIKLIGGTVNIGTNLLSTLGGTGGGGGNRGGDGGQGRIRVEYGSLTGTTSQGTYSTFQLPLRTSGVYTSGAIDITGASVMGTLDWTYNGSGNTSLSFKTRTSPNGSSWSGWSGPLTVSGSSITSPANDFIQYEGTLSGTTTETPSLTSVTVNYLTIIPPTVTLHPQSDSVCGGDTAVFTVAASGDAAFMYQWQKDMNDLTEGGHYSGVETDALTVSDTDGNDVGDYRCVVSNGGGSDTSNPASLTVDTTDGDSDGTPDCNDGCPIDPDKVDPGVCGCGAADDDLDNDGVADCVDACPGVDDTLDVNTNGTPDCVEPSPQYIHFQGKLRDVAGVAIDGTASFRVRLYATEDLPDSLSDEDHNDVVVRYGLFSLLVGSQTAGGLPDSALDARPVYLGISVNGGPELSPRTVVAAAALAFKARNAERLVKPNTFDPAVTVYPNGYLGIGTTSPQYPLHMASGARVTPGGVWTNASSRALKHDIEPLSAEEATSVLADLDPVKFAYNAEPGTVHVGFIAEDAPRLLATPQHDGMSAMDIVAVLTQVLKQQNQMVDQLRCELEAQRERIESQQRQIETFSRQKIMQEE